MSFNDREDLSILNNYFKDIKGMGVELLTPDEEVELAKRIQEGDESAINELVKANLKFVVTIAHDYKGKGVNLSDLVSEGNLGLIKAAQRFDHTKGFRFITYAVWWIKQSILQCLNEHARTIRLPVTVLNKAYQLRKELAENDFSDEPTVRDELEYINNISKCSSLNFNINEDGDEVSDLLFDESLEITVGEEIKNDELRDMISDCMGILDKRERDILVKYYGLFDEKAATLEIIGEDYNLTKERVRQIKSKAIKKLKFNLISIVKAK